MKSLIKNTIFCFLLLIVFNSNGQVKNIGIPSIVNHNRTSYKASTQNWSITQNDKGFIYFGNNDGILEYDGTNWNTYPVSNASVVRTVLAIGDTIYSGAFEEIGFLAPNQKGKLTYNSLSHLIPPPYSNFDEIWNIYEYNGDIIFQSFNYIFIYSNQQMKVIEPFSKFSMLHFANGNFYVVDLEKGLLKLTNDTLQFVSNHPIFFNNEIRCILPLENGDLLIGTSNEGLFINKQNTNKIKPFNTNVNNKLKEHNLFSAIKLTNGNLAFGSVSNGVYLSNQKGEIFQHLNRHKGLQNNTILSLFEDRRNNLWLGLDNGIDYLEISSPITYLNYNFNIESAYASIIHNGILYVGTNQGLYAKEFSKINELSTDSKGFTLIRETEGQVWTLDVIDNTLFCGHNFGSFIIDGFTAKQVSDIRGFWSFKKITDNIILAGTYTGLVRIHKKDGTWAYLDNVKGFSESSRSLFFDQRGNLWISHGYRGIFKLNLSRTLDSVTNSKLYKSEEGLPEQLPYNIQTINSQMYVTTYSGIFQYDYNAETFVKPPQINELFKGKGFIDKFTQDNYGNIWYFTETSMGVLRLLEDGTYIDISSPFTSVNEFLLPAFQNIYTHNQNNVFIGSQKGLIHYTTSITKDYLTADETFINEANFYGKREQSTSFFLGGLEASSSNEPIVLPFSKNSVVFRFTSPSFENPKEVKFSNRLIGFDSAWSDWTDINFKEYTNLKEGSYTFQVKAINAFGTETEIRSFHFTINPPFFRTRGAYIVYITILLLIITGNIYYVRKRILKTRQREKIKHEKRLAQREKIFKEQTALSEKEIMQLRNEGLKNEMKFKNKELANATLHLIQKNKTLTYLKEDLTKLLRSIHSNSPEKHKVNSLLKKINRDLRNEKNWELFNNYFDEVHQDFIKRLKNEYEDLTPKELRLCAYLRMNISTKEIAPLMNISIRGVEISRYRLRKKLNLDHDTNLADFLISF